MLEIKNVEVYGLEKSILASGNPMTLGEINTNPNDHSIFNPDRERVKKLGSAKSGSGHDNFLKGIIVQFDVKYPQYWTPEAQRYHWLEIVSSQSKMHRLTTAGAKLEFHNMFNKYVDHEVIDNVQKYIVYYNELVEETEDDFVYHPESKVVIFGKDKIDELKYYYFMKALSNLPMGYEMWETITTNYLQLKTIYNQRKGHKLKEDWGAFIKMCNELSMFKELIFKE